MSAVTVLVPAELGSIADYDPLLFPRAKFIGKDPLHKGRVYLRATLDEMHRMHKMAKQLEGLPHCKLLDEMKTQYDELKRQEAMLAEEKRSMNPVKRYSSYRSRRLFAEAGKDLWRSSLTTSDRMRRALLSVPSDVIPLEETIEDDQQASGIVVEVEDPFTEEANIFFQETGISEISENPTPPSATGGVQTSTSTWSSLAASLPPSPGSPPGNMHVQVNMTRVYNTNSSSSGMTINTGGNENGGSFIQENVFR